MNSKAFEFKLFPGFLQCAIVTILGIKPCGHFELAWSFLERQNNSDIALGLQMFENGF